MPDREFASTDPSVSQDVAYTLQRQLDRIRSRMIERLFAAAGVFASLHIGVVVWRIHDLGWTMHLRLDAGLTLLLIALVPLRTKLSVATKSALLMACFLGLGANGIVSGGMIGVGYWWFLQSAVLGATLYSLRSGVALAMLAAASMVGVGVAFANGWLTAPPDLASLQRSVSGWSAFLLTIAFAPTVLLLMFSDWQDAIRGLVAEIDARRIELAQRVGHDALTGLPQAALATDRLAAALHLADRSGTKVALLFIDLDGFKGVNDNHGHAAGDHVLRRIALRLGARVRAHDTVARVGGDEFIVILGELTNATRACEVAEQMIADAAEVFTWQQHRIVVGASVGIALYPDDAVDAAGLRARADAAMYQAKRAGRNRWQLAAQTSREEAA